jgi:hypothetical protein
MPVRQGPCGAVVEIPWPPLLGGGAEALAASRSCKGWHDYLVALYETGARPSEVANIEARHYRKKNSCWLIEPDDVAARERGAGKLAYRGKRRVIYLTDRLPVLRGEEQLTWECLTIPFWRRGRQFTRKSDRASARVTGWTCSLWSVALPNEVKSRPPHRRGPAGVQNERGGTEQVRRGVRPPPARPA